MNKLYHHGIKGQKWGVRRYQNKDGTLTNAGRRRYDDYDESGRRKTNTAKKVAAGVAIAGAAALTAYALANPKSREFMLDKVKATTPKVKEFLAENGKKAVKSLGDSVSKAGKAMTDAAMVSIGTISIAKVAQKLETGDDASESVKNRNKVLLDTATAGIKSITNAGNNNKSGTGNSSGKNIGGEITNLIGKPSNKGIDKSSSEYQSLFKDSSGNQRDSDVRATIKSLASAGYDIEQLQRYVDSLKHGAFILTPVDVGRIYMARFMG